MTLVLTELSNAGIVMAADSAISKIDHQGRIKEVDEIGWTKVLRVPAIRSGVSYWGIVGAITIDRFDHWLQARIDLTDRYADLRTFSEFICAELNQAVGNNVLPNNQEVGIHVAGFALWEDRVVRPFFYHIHNGHAKYELNPIFDPNNPSRVMRVEANWVAEPRRLFAVHQDFPHLDKPLDENLRELSSAYTTRNGHFLLYAIIWQHLKNALDIINLIPGISIPKDPNDLAGRKGFLHRIMQTMIQMYKSSNLRRVVGGRVTTVAIRPDGFVND